MTLDALLDTLTSVRVNDLKYEIDNARAIREWAMKQAGIDYEVGDSVEIVTPIETAGTGWAQYADTMAVGARAQVARLGFNGLYGYWYAEVVFEREFSWNDYLKRHNWHGPADQTPEGMEPPSKYDQEHHPEGRKHTFAIAVRHLARVTSIETPTQEEDA